MDIEVDVCAIAQPLADQKLCKKIFKLIKKCTLPINNTLEGSE